MLRAVVDEAGVSVFDQPASVSLVESQTATN